MDLRGPTSQIIMRAKRSLGQNFLTSEKIVADIVGAAGLSQDDIILEVGPGRGILTGGLLKNSKKIIAVEKDDGLFDFLREKFAQEIESEKLILIHGDILDPRLNIPRLNKGGYKLVSNIPYNITGKIIRKFLSAKNRPEMMVLLLQKEVAERITAKDGKESLLSISVKAYGKPKYIKKVSRIFFSPKPKVDSAILLIDEISQTFFKNFPEKEFFTLVKSGFAHKRKKLLNNLKEIGLEPSRIFKEMGLSENIRAERLKPKEWLELAKKTKSRYS
ncbi:ribosomal RNA small subunit methyltransferase A [Candidatus Campbellbacteria bacterium CG11_big_fil_rev_8_21_14_0_20_44_21]|uniref:Ribosomal RNA small subunit methyltransferase A n=1 Tax=Candidatus Campbellbacteria bacterium CG22_combo_CG10-13_8_21_14_all_43_18 TaxID=1974530 RepID=A0A2H0DXM6_9BACT|nr:MAG: ribosomal RNA small subunit methyltransferase A [Candidatus Campbellbacteria bacterium CG22_combo_CG10-13_8_21_14_all_43_18]PIR24188.1 MAG: ribosomal RNA small subunit methyltransferase A [Candidatus Campbellbacteria bacterium CG11_big_fil_rev_8_21_14_0_20_44_21]